MPTLRVVTVTRRQGVPAQIAIQTQLGREVPPGLARIAAAKPSAPFPVTPEQVQRPPETLSRSSARWASPVPSNLRTLIATASQN